MPNANKERKRAIDRSRRLRSGRRDALALIEEEHALRIELCDLLESVAYRLPYNCNKEIAQIVATILRNDFSGRTESKEEMLFTFLRRHSGQSTPLDCILGCLETEHVTSQNLACGLAADLHLLAQSGGAHNALMLDNMLRSFFENQRRHIRWQSAVLLPIARLTLTTEDQVELRSWITSSGRFACMKLSVAVVEDLCDRYAFPLVSSGPAEPVPNLPSRPATEPVM